MKTTGYNFYMPELLDQKQELEKAFTENYHRLNPAQKEAVDTTEGPVMVIAGPGTGKTQILAMRIANILRNPDLDINASNILCLTFTESGVSAMRNRLISFIGSDAYYVRIHTFHSFCNDIIKDNPHKFLAINPISDLEQINIYDEIIDSLEPGSPLKPFGDHYIYRGDLINNVKTLKRESIPVEKLEAAIDVLEAFIAKNADIMAEFCLRNARSIKEEDCNIFLEQIHINSLAHEEQQVFSKLFQDFYDNSSKTAEFKKLIKDFHEKNLKEIPKQRELVKVYQAYNQKLHSSKLYDFEDMILRVISQFEHDPEFLARYQEQFQYILVDEYQDTNGAQNKILEQLTSFYKDRSNIFVVGDDDQSIYRFQGASVENIVYFYKRYQANIKLVVLEQNYRSQQKILDSAHFSIDKNSSRISNLIQGINKQLQSAGHAESYPLEAVELHKAKNFDDEIFQIAKLAKSLIDDGVNPSEIAILFRENRESEAILDLLLKMGLPAISDSGDNLLDNTHICQLIDLLKVIDNPSKHSDLLYNLFHYDFLFQCKDLQEAGVTAKDVFLINRRRQEANRDAAEPRSFFEILLEDKKFSAFADKLLTFNSMSQKLRADDLLEQTVKEFNYLDYILQQKNYVFEINNLDSLFRELRNLLDSKSIVFKKFDASTLDLVKLDTFLAYIQSLQDNNLKIRSQQISYEADAIRLMTAHKSKGLEFDHVLIHACQDKKWGNKVTRNKLKLPPLLVEETEALLNKANDKNEDERRLFFVALTRAKKKAYIFSHKKNNKDQETVPSIFLSELEALKEVTEVVDHSDKPDPEEIEAKLELKFKDRLEMNIELETAYLDSLLENYKLSVTHLNNFLKCKRKFFLQNLIRVPAAKNKHASFGTAIHAALYDLFFAISNGQEFTKDELIDKFDKYIHDERLSEADLEDCLNHGHEVLNEYYDFYQSKFSTENLLEHDFSSLGVHLDGVKLTGKLDKIEILKGDKVNVVDYKTGNPSSKSAALKPDGDYHRQMVFYQLLCDNAYESGQFKYQMQSGEVDFVERDKAGKYKKVKIEVSEDDMTLLKTQIDHMITDIKAHNFSKTEDLQECSRCSFNHICGRR